MKKRILSVILAVFMMLSCVSVSAETAGETASRYLTGIIDLIDKYYKYDDVEKEEIYKAVIDFLIKENPEKLEESIKVATDLLDDYSVYYTKDELGSFVANVNQTYVGIGVTVQKSEAGCIVVEVNENGGAFAAGIKKGDEIISGNGESFKELSLDEIVQKIQGEEGTVVTVEVWRDETYLTLEIERKKINIETVSYDVIDGVGYIYISSFATSTPESLKSALYDLEENQKVKKLIVDVRDNPGGELGSVIDVLNLFVPNGKKLVQFKYKNEKQDYTIKSEAPFSYAPKRKIVVLANNNSASAAELFTAAMQYHKLATVVGQRTFGKGSMQEMLGLINPEGFNLGDVKLTMAEFTKPDGSAINKVGITPDHVVRNKWIDYDESVLTPMTISNRYKIGDEASDVLAIEERLYALGYNVGEVDGVFDKMTHQATVNFQADCKMHPYGVMDYTTQSRLNDEIEVLTVRVDKQLEYALEFLK